jgi:PIN domain nuclease of toxin-antitoxin system
MIVLDTHVWYWWASGQHERLTAGLLETLATAPRVGVSAVSCVEVALAWRKSRLQLPLPLREWFVEALDQSRVELVSLTPAIASRAVELSDQHRDPFDRIIIATTLELDGQLASADGQFPAYPELAGRLLV